MNKVKSKILYIESDGSHQEQNQDDKKNNQPQKSIQTIKNRLNSRAGIKFNNAITKGYFMPEVHEQYFYQQTQSVSNVKIAVDNNLRKSQHSQRLKTQIDNHTQNYFKQAAKQINKRLQTESFQNEKLKQRSKKLMFQFNQSSDDEQSPIQQKKEVQQKYKNKQKPLQYNKFQFNQQQKTDQPNKSNTKFEQQREQQQQQQQDKDIDQEQEQAPNQIQLNLINPPYMYQKIDKKQFMYGELPKNSRLQCKILKKNEILNMMMPQFDMYFRNYLVHIASCKKFIGSIGANYRISTTIEDFSYNNNNFVGKIRSIQSNDLYNVYDDGVKADNLSYQNPQNHFNTRQILATVRIKAGKGPRNITVYVLKHGTNYHNLLGTKIKKQTNLELLYNIEQNRKNIYIFKSRKPDWVQTKKQYYLNFNGRINQASIRNFILQDPQTKRQVLMFGKNANNIYNLDISYPLSPKIGFGIAIPQLDRSD